LSGKVVLTKSPAVAPTDSDSVDRRGQGMNPQVTCALSTGWTQRNEIPLYLIDFKGEKKASTGGTCSIM